ncbi:MAG: rhombosortase [Planctomycetota bacterium]|jgi:rhomboid family GlyGly-CTERM serine protease
MRKSENGSGHLRGVRSALLLFCAAGVASIWPDALLLDRAALEAGEIWRLWTGHFVHLSWEHFAFDVGAAVVLAFFLPIGRALLLFCPLVSFGVLWPRPELSVYGGLSGVLHGLTVLVALRLGMQSQGPARWLCQAIAFGTLLKAIVETALGQPLFTGSVSMGAPTIYVAHLIGALSGLLVALGGGPRHRAAIARAS